MSRKLLFISTPVGFLGSGDGGGVELTIYNLARTLNKQGYAVRVVAPEASQLHDIPLITIAGNAQISAQSQGREAPILMPENVVLANMWHYAQQVQNEYDLIVNFAYDWLPFYLTPFFATPVAHLVSMASVSLAMDHIIQKTYRSFPHLLAFHTVVQAETFSISPPYRCLANGLDVSLYQFRADPSPSLAWVGRIAPEKALEDAIAACQQLGVPLRVFGHISDPLYWQNLQDNYSFDLVDYRGFLPTRSLQKELGDCFGLLMTPRWVEAFGNGAIEALACGVPVVAYGRGGPVEIIEDGKTGFLVEPDSIEGLVTGIKNLDRIDRYSCRAVVEQKYSLEALGNRAINWFEEIFARSQK
ncbi:MAG: glycosyltransferase [Microcystis sp. Msp_OC_L_20101000_S702]|uniref:glycosyltransferase n=1 Tax=Microcystis sp. Msp_OC_L_20101000_S702 TaxID=2486218 RepID=UPI0011931416|nr:glycosyltransferase [Microcystis sp. Msp_OC_L_20101000_S702]TRU14949.1 MAG: glycosyltransferase [Microcystis sp. Msp_OC_L_20101000_S702]